ncbi:unnamed protein product [Mytilus coruscus]|uniref:Uncharacterized protein n=1 Tax=Mytilus coruscus TaxID=42192 RepID=A0A6J8AWU8_MYTCO|nr:unnamed protein product [Mytilus coruscus]
MKENLKQRNWFDNDNTQSSKDEIRKLETHLTKTYVDPYRANSFNFFIIKVDNEILYEEDSEEHKDRVGLSSVLTATKSDNAYYNVPRKQPDFPPSILLGEVIGVNPNSRGNVKHDPIDITKQCLEVSGRKWKRIGSDGMPYNIASSLLDDIYVCSTCSSDTDLRDIN